MKDNFHAPGLEAQLKAAEAEVIAFRKPWWAHRDKYCNGNPCICQSLPLYTVLVTQALQPAAQKVDALYKQWNALRVAAKDAKRRELLRGRQARINYQALQR